MNKKAFVAVLGIDGQPLMPCSGKRARQLLDRKRARVVRIMPFVIQLVDRDQSDSILQDMVAKVDPGSKHTGIAIARQSSPRVLHVTNLIELQHRGQQISRQLQMRAMLRRDRRNRHTRYRQARFLNRTKPKGWLPPSLMHRVITTINWLKKIFRWWPITELALERVKFDTQKMQDDTISGKEYQRGDLYEREIMEYLLEKYQHTCVYCDTKTAFFEKDHVIARSRNGSNRISNLVLACHQCNQNKDNLPIEVFLAHDPSRLVHIQKQLKTPLKDAAATNATRNKLFSEMLKLGLPVETSTGAETKWNRHQLQVPKTHALDAACVGKVKELHNWERPHLEIKCAGHGAYRRTKVDKYGFPRLKCTRTKRHGGFQTGDLVKAYKPREQKSYIGIASVRASLSFAIDLHSSITIARANHCKLLQRNDGYRYYIHRYIYAKVATDPFAI